MTCNDSCQVHRHFVIHIGKRRTSHAAPWSLGVMRNSPHSSRNQFLRVAIAQFVPTPSPIYLQLVPPTRGNSGHGGSIEQKPPRPHQWDLARQISDNLDQRLSATSPTYQFLPPKELRVSRVFQASVLFRPSFSEKFHKAIYTFKFVECKLRNQSLGTSRKCRDD